MAMNAILYYTFHFIYLGHPSDILARLWLTEDLSNIKNNATEGDPEDCLLNDMRAAQAWKAFDDSMRESYKATGIIAGLVAAVVSGLFSIDVYRSHAAVRTVLLASLTSSVFSASLCLSLLSAVYMNPLNIRQNWKAYGIVYIIILSGPSAWLTLALWTLQAAILAIVWIGEGVSARVTVTTVIAIMFLLNLATRLYTLPSNRRLTNFVLLLIGRKHGMSHHMVNLNEDSKKKRMEHIMKVYDSSPAEACEASNLEKRDDDDETRTQIVDDDETSNFNSRSQGSLGQSSAATVRMNTPGGSPVPLLEIPANMDSNQASARLISVGASFFHPYQGRNGSPQSRSPSSTRRVSHTQRERSSRFTTTVEAQIADSKKEEDNQGSTNRIGAALAADSNLKRVKPIAAAANPSSSVSKSTTISITGIALETSLLPVASASAHA